MTGTPVANRPYDLWSQVWFLDQGRALGSDFRGLAREADLTKALEDDEERRAAFEGMLRSLHERVAPFSVRETKASGVIELPSKIIELVLADWEPRQLDLYREIRDSLRAVVLRDGALQEDVSESVLKRLLRLVQVASNPRLVDSDYTAEPGKLPLLRERVEEACRRDEKCIVWTTFTENVDWLAAELSFAGTARVHGGLGMDARNLAIQRFLADPLIRVLVATPGAAKEGLTLTCANHAIFYDRSFSLDDYLQAQDRIHRVSQERTCYVCSLIMRDSVDEWVEVLLDAKRLAAQLAQGDISPDEFHERMQYDWPTVLRAVLAPEEGKGGSE
jgi:SNF2 family DNA or RNA helicase